jgi:hypothetical protein
LKRSEDIELLMTRFAERAAGLSQQVGMGDREELKAK